LRLRRIEPVLRRAFRGACRLEPGSRVLVAVSGGADSTALLVGLRRIAHEFGLEPVAAHLHHGLRGADADRDLDHVRTLCRKLGVPLIAARWDARRRMRTRHLSGEGGLRTLRREFLRAAARRATACAIATAHTADDQLETILMRIARGTGLAGLGAMAPRRGAWLRPLLAATRGDVERDLERAGISWREDQTNTDRSLFRNRIRHDAIPAVVAACGTRAPKRNARTSLRKVRGNHRQEEAAADRATRDRLALNAVALAAEARSAAAVLGRRSSRVLAHVCRIKAGEFRLDSWRVASYPFAFRRAVLRQLWKRVGSTGTGLTRRHLEALEHLLSNTGNPGTVLLPSGIVAGRDRNGLWLRRPSAKASKPA